METLDVLKLSIPALDSKECKAIMGGDGYYNDGIPTDLPELIVPPDDDSGFDPGFDPDVDNRDDNNLDDHDSNHDDNEGNQDNTAFPFSLEDIINTLNGTAQQLYEYRKLSGKVSIFFTSKGNTNGQTNAKEGKIYLTYDPSYPGEPWYYKTSLNHELGHLDQYDLGLMDKFDLQAPLEFQSCSLDFISGNDENSDFLGDSMDDFKDWLSSIEDENGIDLNKFEEGIGDWYDDFVDRWAGIKESYSDDPDYKYQNDIDDMNWEDMFDFYGIRYHR